MAYEDGELVATVLMENDSFLAEYVTLKGYVIYCEEKNKEFKNYLSVRDAKAILGDSLKFNNTSINILAVKGMCQGKGIGTRCVQSINDNLGYFSTTKNLNSINTFIHEDNVASIKVFERNGFKMAYRWYNDSYYKGFDTYYRLGEKEL